MVERQVESEERLANAAHPVERLLVGDGAPGLAAIAVGEERRRRRRPGIVHEPVGQARWKRRQFARLAHDDRPIRPPFDANLRLPETNLAERRRLDGSDVRNGDGQMRVLPRGQVLAPVSLPAPSGQPGHHRSAGPSCHGRRQFVH